MKAILHCESRVDTGRLDPAYYEHHRRMLRLHMARMIEEATHDGRMYGVRRWHGERTDERGPHPMLVVHEAALVVLTNPREVRAVGDVLLNQEFTNMRLNSLGRTLIAIYPASLLDETWTDDPSPLGPKIQQATLVYKPMRTPTGEKLDLWECEEIH